MLLVFGRRWRSLALTPLLALGLQELLAVVVFEKWVQLRLLLRPLNHAGGSGICQAHKPSQLHPGGAHGSPPTPLPKYLRNISRELALMSVAAEALKLKRSRRTQTRPGPCGEPDHRMNSGTSPRPSIGTFQERVEPVVIPSDVHVHTSFGHISCRECLLKKSRKCLWQRRKFSFFSCFQKIGPILAWLNIFV